MGDNKVFVTAAFCSVKTNTQMNCFQLSVLEKAVTNICMIWKMSVYLLLNIHQTLVFNYLTITRVTSEGGDSGIDLIGIAKPKPQEQLVHCKTKRGERTFENIHHNLTSHRSCILWSEHIAELHFLHHFLRSDRHRMCFLLLLNILLVGSLYIFHNKPWSELICILFRQFIRKSRVVVIGRRTK